MKESINLAKYLEDQYGFIIDYESSNRYYVKLSSPKGKEYVVGINSENNYYFYLNLDDRQEEGSIVDFIDSHSPTRISNAKMTLKLRSWFDKNQQKNKDSRLLRLQPMDTREWYRFMSNLAISKNLKRIQNNNRYLKENKIDQKLLDHWRFKGTILQNKGNTLFFPLEDKRGWCGFDVPNLDIVTQLIYPCRIEGDKGLWRSQFDNREKILVISDNAFECLCYAQLNDPNLEYRYVSTSGNIGNMSLQADRLLEILEQAKQLKMRLRIISNNKQLIEDLKFYTFDPERDVKLESHFPAKQYKSWAAELMATAPSLERERERARQRAPQRSPQRNLPSPRRYQDPDGPEL